MWKGMDVNKHHTIQPKVDDKRNNANLLVSMSDVACKARNAAVVEIFDKKTNRSSCFPIIIAYSRPSRMVVLNEKDKWKVTLEQINNREYDYVKLHRLTTSFDIGIGLPFCLHVGFNGAFVLPDLPKFRPIENVLEQYNKFIGKLLLGGIYYEAIIPSELDHGVLNNTGYFRGHGVPDRSLAQIQATIQSKIASPIHSIDLLDPEFLEANELHQAYKKGNGIANQIKNLSPELVLKGTSAFVERAWAEALSNLWMGVEQVIAFLWKEHLISKVDKGDVPISGRREFLKDTRTWTTSTMLELLFHKGVVNGAIYALLNKARKARNALVHRGMTPKREDAEAALDGLFRLIAKICYGSEKYFEEMVNRYKTMDPITKREANYERGPISVKEAGGIWLGPLPSIPGDGSWGDKPYEKVFP